ncbi:MAG: UDP binding domain-containing protein, partial [Candidatus Sedimenticola sp. 6PFRAG1]
VGGHCIAVDPEWLKAASKKAGYMPEIIQLSRLTNNGMPEYAVSLLQDALNECGYPIKGTRIAVLGVAYKRNVDDPRESPFFDVRNLLEIKGATLAVYDSWIESDNTESSLDDVLRGAKAVMIVTDHDDVVSGLNGRDLRKDGIEVVIDGRNCLDGENIAGQGVLYRGVGRRA